VPRICEGSSGGTEVEGTARRKNFLAWKWRKKSPHLSRSAFREAKFRDPGPQSGSTEGDGLTGLQEREAKGRQAVSTILEINQDHRRQ